MMSAARVTQPGPSARGAGAPAPGAAPARPVRPARPARCGPATLAADLRIALTRVVRRLRAERSDEDLSDAQYAVLAVLDRHGPLAPGELAEHERVQPPSMTRTVAALTALGLVTRTPHPVDRRQIVVALTGEGSAVVRETRRRRDAWLARRLAELSPQERDVMAQAAEILRRIATA